MNDSRKEIWKINAVVKATEILECFTANQPQFTLSQLAAQMDLPKSSVSNILKTLIHCKLLEKDDATQMYRLGIQILEMSYSVRKGMPIIDFVMRNLDDLQQQTGEIVYFTIPRNGKVLYLDASYPGNKRVTYSVAGKTLYMHCTGVGKAMLSALPDADIRKIIDFHGMPRFTPDTITDFNALMEQIEEIRKRGYSIDLGEESYGVKCVAVPIMKGDLLLGGISISGSPLSIPDDKIYPYAQLLQQTASTLSAKADIFPKYDIVPM